MTHSPPPISPCRRLLFWLSAATIMSVAAYTWQRSHGPVTVVFADSDERDALRVLFIGNSLTSYHDMPALLVELLRTHEPHRPLKVMMVAANGFTLEDHCRTGEGLRALRDRGPWDFVVLQEKGGITSVDWPQAERSARWWADQVQMRGATPVFWVDWLNPPRTAAGEYGYHQIAADLNVPVVPLTDVWAAVQPRLPHLPLLADDKAHPSARGSYLIACVCYAVLTGRSPLGLPAPCQYHGRNGQPLVVDFPRPEVAEAQAQVWEVLKTLGTPPGRVNR